MRDAQVISSAEASLWAAHRAEQEAMAAQARADGWMATGIVAIVVLVIVFTALAVRKDVARAIRNARAPKAEAARKGRRSLSFTRRDED